MKARFRYLVFVISLLAVACAPDRLGLDSGIFSGKPCGAPCWQNLTPGQSTEVDLDSFIGKLSTKDWPARNTISYSPSCKIKAIADRDGIQIGSAVRFSVEDGKLTFVESIHDNFFTLQEAVGHLGPPEYFEAVLAIGPDGSSYGVEVYYPSRGLALMVSPSQADAGYIKPNMMVSSIQYFARGSLLSYLTVKRSCFIGPAQAMSAAQIDIARYIQPWSGFGAVKVVTSQ